MPPRLHVFLIFMTQFIVVMALLGGVVPLLHARGLSWAVLVPAAAAALVVLHYLIAVAGRLIPVWCRECKGRSRYRGFGWWPFTYCYDCTSCGTTTRYEVVG